MGEITPLRVPATGPQASRTLMVLGILQGGPRHGYDLHRIMMGHGSQYPAFKKPTLYHLLARLAEQGAVAVTSESGARGPRGERLVYAITDEGRQQFRSLLRAMLGSYDDDLASFRMAAGFLSWIPAGEGVKLLGRRRRAVVARRAEVAGELDHASSPAVDGRDAERRASRFLAADYALCHLDAELAWIDRTVGRLAAPANSTWSKNGRKKA